MARHQTSPPLATPLSLTCLFLAGAILVLSAHAQAQPQRPPGLMPSTGDQGAEGAFTSALRQVLSERGLDESEVDEILFAVGSRLLHLLTASASKRAGWKRIPIQTRFAPFGTKLVPSRNRGDSNGPTLLRYGRSL